MFHKNSTMDQVAVPQKNEIYEIDRQTRYAIIGKAAVKTVKWGLLGLGAVTLYGMVKGSDNDKEVEV